MAKPRINRQNLPTAAKLVGVQVLGILFALAVLTTIFTGSWIMWLPTMLVALLCFNRRS